MIARPGRSPQGLNVAASHAAETVRKARREDLAHVTEILTQSFFDDPVMTWRAPSAATRAGTLRKYFGQEIRRYHKVYDEIYVDRDFRSAAVWAPPTRANLGRCQRLSRTLRLRLLLGANAGRYSVMYECLDAATPPTPHYYLDLIGTVPAFQNQGLGRALMDLALRRCDREGVPAYLEASTERSIPLYERLGFQLIGEVEVPDGPTLWQMWRD